MAGRGPAPKAARRRATAPTRGDWTATAGVGWQHGPIPDAPAGLAPATVETWQGWMRSWVAAHWTPGDLPGLHIVIRLWDDVHLGRMSRASELRLWSDTYGITPKGQQDRRWSPPTKEAAKERPPRRASSGLYDHLRIVPDEEPSA